MKVLWITPKWPFPITDGARIATTQLLKSLTARGIEIHLCSIVEERCAAFDRRQAIRELGVKKVTLVRRRNSSPFRMMAHFISRPFFPVTLAPYSTQGVSRRIKALIKKKRPDLVVYDGLHAAAWRKPLESGERDRPIVLEAYRAHNVESEIWFRSASQTFNPLKKAALFFQGLLVSRLESRLVSEAHFIFPVSIEDKFTFKVYGMGGEVSALPIGIQIPEVPEAFSALAMPKPERSLLFVGKLDWAPNREGLQWILRNVWPHVAAQAKDMRLTIVGSGASRWLDAYRHLPGLNIVGQVPDLVPYYEDCIATLVPIFYGGGTRVKAIESSLYGRACVSTGIGVEGVGLEPGRQYYRAETAKEWVDTLVSLEPNEALDRGTRARDYARIRFNPEVIAGHFVDVVSSWSPPHP